MTNPKSSGVRTVIPKFPSPRFLVYCFPIPRRTPGPRFRQIWVPGSGAPWVKVSELVQSSPPRNTKNIQKPSAISQKHHIGSCCANVQCSRRFWILVVSDLGRGRGSSDVASTSETWMSQAFLELKKADLYLVASSY